MFVNFLPRRLFLAPEWASNSDVDAEEGFFKVKDGSTDNDFHARARRNTALIARAKLDSVLNLKIFVIQTAIHFRTFTRISGHAIALNGIHVPRKSFLQKRWGS